MKKNIEFTAGGLKCDNPECDYWDTTVPVSDYKSWLNHPCPKCGWNLLTEADYKAVKRMHGIISLINLIPPIFFRKEKRVRMTANFNGTGRVMFGPVTPKEEE